ncbi:recombinase RecT [Caballeronia sp. LZ019]|uniref:recombinase RecT n=1 Tax=Caballeronia sp. LZ019 TaxID=3038555 RepID=UPI0028550F6A|nr:recombinase RecT [Caballeronia sp. LZ019]MDR5807663.1 recombinase RecT [Caballeronia sp. LZ019]
MTDPRTDEASTRIAMFRRDLDSPAQREQLRVALPRHIDLDTFCRVVMTAVQSNDDLAKASPRSLLRATMECASDGLLPDGREGAIVAYRYRETNSYIASWQPMVWGLVKLVRQSGELTDLGAHVVTLADRFDYVVDEYGEHSRHHPDFQHPEAAPLLVYAYARTRDDGRYFEPMPWFEVEKFSALSQAHAEEAPWKRWPQEMAKVRVIRRLCKRLPMSTDARAVLARDDAREAQRFSLKPADEDPITAIATMNAAIREAAASAVPALDRPAAAGDAQETDGASRAAKAPRSARARSDASPLGLTYAQIAERLKQAKDRASLAAAAKLIDALADSRQREELHEMAEHIDGELTEKMQRGVD